MTLAKPVQCITDHPGFEAVCLNVWVLQSAYFQFRAGVWNKYNSINYKQVSFNMIHE